MRGEGLRTLQNGFRRNPMLHDHWQDRLAAPTRQLQIIVFAMTAGCVMFMAIAVVLRGSIAADPPDVPIVTYVALAICAGVALARAVIVPTITSRGCDAIARGQCGSTASPSDTGAAAGDDLMLLGRVYTTTTIVGAALFEGGTFFLLVSYLVEGQMVSLIAAMAMTVAIALHFPTRSRVAAWIESKSERIDQERQFGR
jgi:hypothetical protein